MNHPNKREFAGVLSIIGQPSDKAPSGARGHKIILTEDAVRKSLATLIGMGINVSTDKHKADSKVGIIDAAEIRGKEIVVSGYIFARDCPAVIEQLQGSTDYGMSYELADAHIEDIRAEVWVVTRLTFTGAAVLLRENVAYRLTNFVLL